AAGQGGRRALRGQARGQEQNVPCGLAASLFAMGLLDDAIREHLELKRRHGADPGDLAKLEREAFGPIKRGAEPAEEPEPEAAAPAAPKPEPVDPVLTEPEVDAPPPAPAADEVDEEHVTWDEPLHGPG